MGQREAIHLRNAAEAGLLAAILREAGIGHYIKAYDDPAVARSWTLTRAWGQVECSEADEASVREILEGLRGASGGP